MSTDEQTAILQGIANRVDSISSTMAAIKMHSGRMSPGAIQSIEALSREDTDRLYRGNIYAGRIIDMLPEECTRRGWEVAYGGEDEDDDIGDPIGDEFDRLDVRSLFAQADKLARKDGESAIFMGLDDGQPVDQPVDVQRLRAVTHLLLLERWTFEPLAWQEDFTRPGYGKPTIYQITPYSPGSGSTLVNVHASRLITFPGRWLPDRLRSANGNHDDSILQRCWAEILDFTRTNRDIAAILRSYSHATVKLKGLAQVVSSGNSEAVLSRLELLNLSLDVAGMHVLDADGEELSFVSRSTGGLESLYDRLAQTVATAAEMPVTLLFGQSPGGLSTDDAGGARYWYDRVADRQANVYRPRLDLLADLLASAKAGPCKGVVPDYTIRFRALQAPTEAEEAQTRGTQASTDKTYWEMGVVDASEIRRSRFGGSEWTAETTLLEDVSERMEAESEAAQADQQVEDEARVDAAEKYSGIDFTPPAGVREGFRRGLQLHAEGKSGEGLEAVTVAWARKLARGQSVSPEKALQGARFWSRSERFLDEPKDSPAYTSAMLWGGAPGKAWFGKLAEQIRARDEEADKGA